MVGDEPKKEGKREKKYGEERFPRFFSRSSPTTERLEHATQREAREDKAGNNVTLYKRNGVCKYGVFTKRESRWLDVGQVPFFRLGPYTQKKEKKRMRPISSHLNRKSLVNIRLLLFGFRGNFSRGTRRLVPSGQESSILLTRVVNHGVRFGLSCLLTELAI